MEIVTKIKKQSAYTYKFGYNWYTGYPTSVTVNENGRINNDVVINYSPYRVPNHRTKIRTRQQAASYLSVSSRKTILRWGAGTHSIPKYPGYPSWYPIGSVLSGSLITPPYVDRQAPSVIPTKVINQAKTRFLRKVQGAQTLLQSGVLLGERRDAVRTLESAGKLLKGGVTGLLSELKRERQKFNKRIRGYDARYYASTRRRSLGKDTAAATDYLSEKWLEFSFGVKPLVADIKSAAQAAAKLCGNTYQQPSVLVQAGAELNEEPVWFGSDGDIVVGTTRYAYKWYRQDKFDVKYYGVVSLDPSTVSTDRVLGFNPGSFLPTIWELIPYSFLADYFTNIGDIISATCYGAGGLQWVSQGTKATRTVYNGQGQHSSAGPGAGAIGPGGCQDVATELNRSPITASDLIPTFEWQIPGHPTQWVNMAALAILHRKLIPFVS